jgi:hypothetical protein
VDFRLLREVDPIQWAKYTPFIDGVEFLAHKSILPRPDRTCHVETDDRQSWSRIPAGGNSHWEMQSELR